MPAGQAEWQTPVAYMKNRQEIFAKLDKTDIIRPVDLEKEISYFNNERAKGHTAAFDLFFAYTKTFPLFDPRKLRDDRKYLPDIWENIHDQEEGKPVPALTSMQYGRRPIYDPRLVFITVKAITPTYIGRDKSSRELNRNALPKMSSSTSNNLDQHYRLYEK